MNLIDDGDVNLHRTPHFLQVGRPKTRERTVREHRASSVRQRTLRASVISAVSFRQGEHALSTPSFARAQPPSDGLRRRTQSFLQNSNLEGHHTSRFPHRRGPGGINQHGLLTDLIPGGDCGSARHDGRTRQRFYVLIGKLPLIGSPAHGYCGDPATGVADVPAY